MKTFILLVTSLLSAESTTILARSCCLKVAIRATSSPVSFARCSFDRMNQRQSAVVSPSASSRATNLFRNRVPRPDLIDMSRSCFEFSKLLVLSHSASTVAGDLPFSSLKGLGFVVFSRYSRHTAAFGRVAEPAAISLTNQAMGSLMISTAAGPDPLRRGFTARRGLFKMESMC